MKFFVGTQFMFHKLYSHFILVVANINLQIFKQKIYFQFLLEIRNEFVQKKIIKLVSKYGLN